MTDKQFHRTVGVSRDTQELTYLDKDGNSQLLGTVAMDDFADENLRKFNFTPSPGNPWATKNKLAKGYELGIGSSNLRFVDPASTMEILMESGWQVKDQVATSGGLEISTTFIRPEAHFVDPINHDLGFWGNPARAIRPGTHERTNVLFPALRLDTSLFIGRMASTISSGIYRLICTNGLISQLMELPGMAVRHDTWDANNINKFVTGLGEEWDQQSLPLGPLVSDARSMKRAVGLMKQYAEESNSEAGLSERFKMLARQFKSFSGSVLSPWTFAGYVEHLELKLDGIPDDTEIFTIDLLNAYTSAINAHRDASGSDRGAWSASYAAERVMKTTTDFARLAGIFLN